MDRLARIAAWVVAGLFWLGLIAVLAAPWVGSAWFAWWWFHGNGG